jgi:hypothetical protein
MWKQQGRPLLWTGLVNVTWQLVTAATGKTQNRGIAGRGVFCAPHCNGYVTVQKSNCKKMWLLCGRYRDYMRRTSCHYCVIRVTNTTRKAWRLEASSTRSCRWDSIGKCKTLWHTSISTYIRTAKGLWTSGYSKWTSSASIKKTTGKSHTFIWSLLPAVPFSTGLEGRKIYNVTETWQGPKIIPKCTSD